MDTQTELLEDMTPAEFDSFDDDDSGKVDFFAAAGETGADDAPEFEETDKVLPPYDFAENPRIVLKDGTYCEFQIPPLLSEQRADDLRKTTTITSSHKINGVAPKKDFTDHFKADVRYFLDNALKIGGMEFNPGDGAAEFDAKKAIRREKQQNGKVIEITYAHLVPIKHKRSFVARLYGGKVEIEKALKTGIVSINAPRFVIVRQDLGVEATDDGKTTPPTNTIRYKFREPNSGHLTKWQKCWNGYSIAIKGGGQQSESSFITENVANLFDELIEEITGAAVRGEALNVKNIDHLKAVPYGVKRNMMAIAMGEFTGDVGN